MAQYDGFTPAINSTGAGSATDPASTGVVIAAIDSTQLSLVTNATVLGTRGGRNVLGKLTATLGGNSSFVWRVEQSISSTITDAPKFSVAIHTPPHQTGTYVFTVDLAPGDYVRARGASTGTGTFNAFLQVDPLV